MAQSAYKLAKQYGIADSTIQSIQKKAENNIAMDTPTKEKQAVYNAYQSYYASEIAKKAREGASLDRPNEWKNNLYAQASANLNPNDRAYYNTNNIMTRQENKSKNHLDSQNKLLEQNAKAQLQAQEAQFAKLRDQEIANIQAELDQAVADGKLSIQEAETQFKKQKEAIYAQNYVDSEYTKAQAQARGIQNSQQLMGMDMTRQANTTSLLNNNMTERDNKIFQINTRLTNLNQDALRNINLARTNYGYNVAGAEGQINAQMFQNKFNMSNEEYARLQNLQGQLDMTGLAQRNTQDNMKLEQSFNLENLSLQQRNTLEQMAVAQGYDLAKMSKQQQYALAQMATQYGYDVGLQGMQQSFQAGQNALDRSFQSSQNALDRNFQSSQNALDRKFQASQAQADRTNREDILRLQSQLGREDSDYAYEQQRQREYNAYNIPSSKEYKIRNAQQKTAWSETQTQTMFNVMTDVQLNGLASRMESLPTLSTKPTQKEIDAYNKQVNNLNTYIKQVSPTTEMYEMFKVPTYGGGSSTTKKNNNTTKKNSNKTNSTNKYTNYSQTPRGNSTITSDMWQQHLNRLNQ